MIDVRTPMEHLENIRSVLNPPISELAMLFGVSRQAIYKWLAQDSSPEADKLARIVALSKIADAFKEAKIQRAGTLLYIKISDGESLCDLLRADKPYDKQLAALIAESKIMEANYQQSGLSQSNTKPTNDWLSSISIPAYREESQ
jgi:transcriptional regulator with XRE-family HTH domain